MIHKDDSTFQIVQQNVPTMYFIGVTTGQSAMKRIFPRWASILGIGNAQLIGVDLPLQASPHRYREVVSQIKCDPLSMGALITTHKIHLFHAAQDLFDILDQFATLYQEVSCLSKQQGNLVAQAKDAPCARQALQALLGQDYWTRNSGAALCLGAGGAGTAIIMNLLASDAFGSGPQRLLVVNNYQYGLDRLRAIVEQAKSPVEVEYILNTDPLYNDRLLAALPERSLVINATGMGKDLPGSPITDAGLFPLQSVAWELNYRGKLDFLSQAQAQAQERQVRAYDGWEYFVISWAAYIAEIFHLTITQQQFIQLKEIAEELRI